MKHYKKHSTLWETVDATSVTCPQVHSQPWTLTYEHVHGWPGPYPIPTTSLLERWIPDGQSNEGGM